MSKKGSKKPEDEAKESTANKAEVDKQNELPNNFFWISMIVAPLVVIITILFVVPTKHVFINKAMIQKDISIIIQNDANLEDVKQVFKNRKLITPNIFQKIFYNLKPEEHYDADNPLSEILKDIRVEIYLGPDSSKKVLLDPLNKIIKNYSQVNPFDKLESSQKDMFEAIRAKLPKDYPKIQNDINKISEELNNKNLLVTKYLNKSTTSFWISIVAVFFSLVIGFYQIYQNSRRKIRYINTGEDQFIRAGSTRYRVS